jgi:hypothetical protein
MGGILWRMAYYKEKNNDDPIIWNNNRTAQYPRLIPGYGPGGTDGDREPNNDEFFYLMEQKWENWGMFFGNGSYGPFQKASNQATITFFRYHQIDTTIRGLPNSIKNKLIKYFKDWVNDSVSGFDYFQNELEIWYGRDRNNSIDKYESKWTNLNGKLSLLNNQANWVCNTSDVVEILNDNENILKNYCMVTPAKQGSNYQFQLELRPNTEVMTNILSLLTEPVYLQNITPYSWVPQTGIEIGPLSNLNPLYANKNLMDQFIESFFEEINKATPNSETTEDDQAEVEVFGTSDDKTINLLIYRTLSSINDKWINGTDDYSIFNQCGGNNVNSKDKELASKYRTNTDKPELIDTFRFVDRAFWDIGDKFYLNINAISDIIKHHYNDSFFDVVNKILTDNNFNFIPLPTFVNFNNIEELKEVFTPYSYNDIVKNDGTGPSFVCVFVGQSSTNLDLGPDSVYPDDGLSLSMDESGSGLNLLDEQADFAKDVEAGEFNVPVFAVNYGQQNQNYFKSVRLDQREFTETMESLQIIEDISQNGDKSKPTYAGNNLFNVYQTRSYSAEVEMMGSAMIQPMMYFQLNNIPMFRGAYLIYKVNHSIKPHNMITTIKGNRVKKGKTPLIDKATMYMNLVGGSSAGTSNIRAASGDPNSKPTSKFIDTNLQLYWLDSNGKIPTGKDTLGISNKNNTTPGLKKIFGQKDRTYLVREVAEVVQYAAYWFNEKHKNSSTGPDTILYGELNNLWGGNISGHKGHSDGLVGDFYQSRNDKNKVSNPQSCKKGGDYNIDYTYEWVEKILQTPYRKYTIPSGYKGTITYYDLKNNKKTAKAGDTISDQRSIEKIFFNDPDLQNRINSKFGSKLMTTLDGHCNHLHIEFYVPVRVAVESELTNPSVNSRPATQANPSDTGDKTVTNQDLPSLNSGTTNFINKLLDKLGAPKTDGNKFLLMAWIQEEGCPCAWNPLSSKQGGGQPCITTGSNSGVDKYQSLEDGLNATYKTITNNKYNDIISALKSGLKTKQDAYNFAAKSQQSPNGGFCVWVKGETGCKNSNGIPTTKYVAKILGTGKMSGKNISGSN